MIIIGFDNCYDRIKLIKSYFKCPTDFQRQCFIRVMKSNWLSIPYKRCTTSMFVSGSISCWEIDTCSIDWPKWRNLLTNNLFPLTWANIQTKVSKLVLPAIRKVQVWSLFPRTSRLEVKVRIPIFFYER